ncbi:MFS transporter [Marinomonas sp. C2222]|uniref:MFS transporter n=1 Tax=Marinomonas sargassi TaxID=2984494 RepID=A0ABT2YQ84_9GAMM|nr:MFS transporter [Marinomonas sargassi]MCV2401849.1 MFS transporter [Marinomonas sargassi]
MRNGQSAQYPWGMLASVYITQYIGIAFILSAAVAILRQQGIALDKLALLNLAVLPMMGKLLYAPFIDKYKAFLQGKYRSWLIISQSCMTLLLLIAGLMDFSSQFHLIITCLAFYAFFTSIQDVSIDGLSCKLFPPDKRKLASSIQFSGNLLGNILGGGLILMFYSSLEWQGALWVIALLTSLSLLQTIFFQEPNDLDEDDINPENPTNLLYAIKVFVLEHKSWFTILALYPIASTCGFSLINPLLVDHGWALGDIGFVMKIYGSIIGLISALLAAPLIARIGQALALSSAILLQVIALAMVIPLTLGSLDKTMVYAAVTLHFMSFPALLVITSTIIIDKAADTHHKATFFTLQFSFASLLGFLYSGISMTIAKHVGYSTVVTIGTMLSICIAFFIVLSLKRKTAQYTRQHSLL